MTCHYVHDRRDVVENKEIYVSLLEGIQFFPTFSQQRVFAERFALSRIRPLIDVSIPANLSSVAFGRPEYCIPFHKKKVRRQVIQMVR